MEITTSIVESNIWDELDNVLEGFGMDYDIKKVDIKKKKVIIEFDVIIDEENEYIGLVKH